MSLNKAIAAGKERRRPYRRSKAFDASCRNHGSCSWCLSNRTVGDQRRGVADGESDNHVPVEHAEAGSNPAGHPGSLT